MNDHVTEWLGAYLDGEVHGERLQQVGTHLLTCTICQADLDSLQRLSNLLQEMPAAVSILPADRFVPHVLLRLPSRPQPLSDRILKTSWSLVPAILLAALVFFQTVWVVNGLALLAGQTGLFGATFTWLEPVSTQGAITAGIAYLLNAIPGHAGQVLIEILNGGEWLNNTLLIPLSIQVSLMLLFASWLASWFAQRHAIPNRAGQR
jgi:predicted anti-sigma-YlaC factor YlaD